MSTGDEDLLRDVTREVLAELLPGFLEEALATPATNGSGNGNGQRAGPSHAPLPEREPVVPQVPAPPIAKVHRPSGWVAPALAETVPERSVPAVMPDGGAIEHADLRSNADLDAFVRMLARRLESPRERAAILAGRVRFQLAATSAEGAAAEAAPVLRIEKGAVTERAVKEAARTGARLVLSPRAVLTPMARDRARSLGVEIEKESPC